MNKRGFLLAEETLKIIIAVIALGFLAYFLVSLYFSAQSSKELEQAEASLNFLISEAKAGKTNVDIYNPKDWWILSGNTELCICKDNKYASCEEKGVCGESIFVIENPIKIENPPITLNIDQTNNGISE